MSELRGEQQLVMIVRALMHEPTHLLASRRLFDRRRDSTCGRFCENCPIGGARS